MIRRTTPVVLAAVLLVAGIVTTTAAPPARAPQDIDVYFSPAGGCTDAIVKELGAAKKSIAIQAYSFTSTPIAKAIVDAKGRGVEIIVVLDKSQKTEKYTSATFLANSGVP